MKTLLFDTETTGLIKTVAIPPHRQPFVIEFSSCMLDEASGEETWHEWLFSVPVPIEAKITEITGITPEMLQGQPTFAVAADEIEALIRSADRVAAHNLSFDRDMLDIEFKRLGRRLVWPELVCTMEATAHWEGRWLNLGALHERLFGQRHENAHRARPDVEALVRCYKKLREMGEM